METNLENQPEEQIDIPRLEIGEESQIHLRETKQWANFLAIIGFIFIGLIVVMAFSVGAIFSSIGPGFDGFPMALFGGIYLLMAIVYFFPVLYLYKFAEYMGKALSGKNPVDLNASFRNLKAHYRYIGILMVIMLSLYIIGIIIAAIIGIAAH